jgi:cell division protein FtsL
MTEYYTVKRIDNSRLIRPMAPARLKDYWRRVGVGAAMAACLLIYTWQHFECIRLRYEVQKLQADRAEAFSTNARLHIQVSSLNSPSRVDTIAQSELGMTIHTPGEAISADSTAVDAVLLQAHLPSQQRQ